MSPTETLILFPTAVLSAAEKCSLGCVKPFPQEECDSIVVYKLNNTEECIQTCHKDRYKFAFISQVICLKYIIQLNCI